MSMARPLYPVERQDQRVSGEEGKPLTGSGTAVRWPRFSMTRRWLDRRPELMATSQIVGALALRLRAGANRTFQLSTEPRLVHSQSSLTTCDFADDSHASHPPADLSRGPIMATCEERAATQ